MIASFMLYASIVTACLAVAALAIESLLRRLGRPVRGVWIGAFAVTLLLLGLAPLRREASIADESAPTLSTRLTTLPFTIAPSAAAVPPRTTNLLIVGWTGASVLLALLVLAVQVRYRRMRGRWPAATVGGATVRVSPSLGPAVMGLWRPEIVVPHWLLERGSDEQAIVVAHEREHLRARDPLLLESALLIVLLMPWNAALWWMFSRLRFAVELDCDSRVLRAGTTAQVYGNLLIDVAALHAGHRAPAIALLDPPSNLERRLNAMRPQSVRYARLRLTAAGVVALGAFIVACQAELPTDRTVAEADVGSMERIATMHRLGDTVLFKVDGQLVQARVAEMIAPDEITSVRVEHGAKDGGASLIAVTTNQNGLARTNKVAYKAEAVAPVNEFTGEALRVTENAHEALGVNAGVRRDGERREAFHGLLFINGKRADASEFEKIDHMSIKSVEVIKGPSPQKVYNDPAAAFGVIRIITK